MNYAGARKRGLKLAEGLLSALKSIWSMTTGKVALALLALLLALSIAAVAVMPPGFLVAWRSAGYWEENPVVVPPSWATSLGYQAAQHLAKSVNTPRSVLREGGHTTLVYEERYNLDVGALPKGLLVRLSAPLLCVGDTLLNPFVSVEVVRPDRATLVIAQKYLGRVNATCGDIVTDKFLPTDATLTDLVSLFMRNYNITLNGIGPNGEAITYALSVARTTITQHVRGMYLVDAALFMYPEEIAVRFKRESVASKLSGIASSIKSLEEVVDAENLKAELRQARLYLDSFLANESSTYSDALAAISNALSHLDKAWRFSMVDYPEYLGNVTDIKDSLKDLFDRLLGSTEGLDVSASFAPLRGMYVLKVKVTYGADLAKTPSIEVRFVVKGGAYGLMGTASIGVDIARVVLYGTPIALLIGLVAAVASTLIGVFAGIVSGYYGGAVDEVIQRTADIIGNIPFLPVAIIVGSMAQAWFAQASEAKSLYIILVYILLLVVFGWGGLAITVRAMTLSIKEEPYVEAAKALGASSTRIIFWHILPQVLMYATAALVFNVPSAILLEAGLSVLGLRHDWPTWGSLLADARAENRLDVWWWILPPGLMISLTSLTFVLLGLAIERIVEPRLRTL